MTQRTHANMFLSILLAAMMALTACSGMAMAEGDITLPITEEPITLTWFVPLYNSNVLQSANDQYCWQEIQRRTGITIEFVHPPVGSENDTFNVRIASGDYPDIITWPWANFSGGPTKALNDGIIIDLKDLMNEYAPNYNALLDGNEVARANAMLDDGSAYGFIHVVPEASINAIEGLMMRKDWLDKLGLEAPTTIEEWHTVLTAFKEQDPNGNGEQDEIPFIASGAGGMEQLAAAWGVRRGFFPKDGKIVYGAIQPEFKEFVAEMAKWYAEGLIDPEYPTNARKNVDEKMVTGVAGSLYGLIGSQLGSYVTNGKQGNPDFDLIGLNMPLSSDGVSYALNNQMAQGIGAQSSAISSKNAYPVETAKLLDYCYSEEGRMLLNWGKEGESYEIVDGKPQYTDLVMNNPEGKTKLDVVAQYAVPIYGYFSAFYPDSYASINLNSDAQKEAAAMWAEQDFSLLMPVLYPTEAESAIISKKGADIDTYATEMYMKFIIGKESLDQFDEYVAAIERMGIQELVDVYQAMYDRNLDKVSQ